MKKTTITHRPNVLGPLSAKILEGLRTAINNPNLGLGNHEKVFRESVESAHFHILGEWPGLFTRRPLLLEIKVTTDKSNLKVTNLDITAYGSWTHGTEVIKTVLSNIDVLKTAICVVKVVRTVETESKDSDFDY